MNKVYRLWTALFVLSIGCHQAVPETSPTTTDLTLNHLAVETFVLPNGLQVVLHPDPSATMSHVHMSYRVGSRDDPTGKTGLALVAEHLMYQGTPNRPKPYLEQLEEMGINIRDGGIGGETSYDRTTFAVSVASEMLSHLLWLEADRMRGVAAGLTENHVATQVSRVKALYQKQALPRRDRIHAHMYPVHHPYHHPVRGHAHDLEQIHVDDVRQFFSQHYAPNRAVLTVAGPFAPKQVKDWVESFFTAIPVGEPVARLTAIAKPNSTQTMVEGTHAQNRARLTLAWPGPADHQVDTLAMEVLAAALSEPLPDEAEAKAFVEAFELGGLFVWEATKNRPWQSDEVKKTQAAVTARLEFIAKEGLPYAVFIRVRDRIIQSYLADLEHISGNQGRLANLSRFSERWPHLNGLQARLLGYQKLTREDIRLSVQRYLLQAPGVIAVDHPLPAPGGIAGVDSPQPKNKTPSTVNTPKMSASTLENGLQIAHMIKPTIPLWGVSLVFRAPPTLSFVEREKLLLAFHVMAAKAGKHAKWLEDRLIVELTASGSILTIRCLPGEYDRAVHLLWELVTSLHIDQGDLALARESYLASWSETDFFDSEQRLEWMRRATALKSLGTSRLGHLRQMDRWTSEDLHQAVKAHLSPQQFALIIASSQFGKPQREKIATLFGSLPKKTVNETVPQLDLNRNGNVTTWNKKTAHTNAAFSVPFDHLTPAQLLVFRMVFEQAMLSQQGVERTAKNARQLFAGQEIGKIAWHTSITDNSSLNSLMNPTTSNVFRVLDTPEQLEAIKMTLLATMRERLQETTSTLRETAWLYLSTGKIVAWEAVTQELQQLKHQDLKAMLQHGGIGKLEAVSFGIEGWPGAYQLSFGVHAKGLRAGSSAGSSAGSVPLRKHLPQQAENKAF